MAGCDGKDTVDTRLADFAGTECFAVNERTRLRSFLESHIEGSMRVVGNGSEHRPADPLNGIERTVFSDRPFQNEIDRPAGHGKVVFSTGFRCETYRVSVERPLGRSGFCLCRKQKGARGDDGKDGWEKFHSYGGVPEKGKM